MKTYLRDLRWGKFNLIEGDMISRITDYCGEWSDVEVALFQKLLSPNANVIEVGSNIGLHAVPLAKFIPQGKLLCFEPQRIIFQQLCCNLALNNLINVESFRLGVGEKSEKIWIESSDYGLPWNYGSFSLNKGFSTEGQFTGKVEKEEVEVIALDDFTPARRLSSLDLLKIDAEGFDIRILHGARELISQHQPDIFIEVQLENIEATRTAVEALGYQAFWFVSKRYQVDNFYGVPEWNSGVDTNFLCIAKRKLANPNAVATQIAHKLLRVTPINGRIEIPLLDKTRI